VLFATVDREYGEAPSRESLSRLLHSACVRRSLSRVLHSYVAPHGRGSLRPVISVFVLKLLGVRL
jgi:hypothetical protein